MTVDVAKARALVERLRVVPFIDDDCPHCVADLIDALLDERDALIADIRDLEDVLERAGSTSA